MIAGKLKFVGVVLIAASLGLPASLFSQDATHFQPVEALSVADIAPPAGCYSYGTVVLDVLVSENGEVKNVQVRREIAGLTETAVRAVKAWSFHPAELGGMAISSRITVAITFNPQVTMFHQVPLPALIREDDEMRIQSAFQPPEVVRAIMPAYALGATSVGAVILTVAVDENGKGRETRVLRELAPFTSMALGAVDDWRFMAATLNGKPLKANVILAFVFPPLQSDP